MVGLMSFLVQSGHTIWPRRNEIFDQSFEAKANRKNIWSSLDILHCLLTNSGCWLHLTVSCSVSVYSPFDTGWKGWCLAEVMFWPVCSSVVSRIAQNKLWGDFCQFWGMGRYGPEKNWLNFGSLWLGLCSCGLLVTTLCHDRGMYCAEFPLIITMSVVASPAVKRFNTESARPVTAIKTTEPKVEIV